MIKKFLSYLNKRLFYIWMLFFSFLTLIMSPENSLYYGLFIIFIIYYLVYSFNQKLFLFLVFFVVITLSLYHPINLSYGSLNSGIVAALFETNFSESFEFLTRLDLKDLSFPLLFLLSAIILFRLMRYNKSDQIMAEQEKSEEKRQKILKIILIFVVLLSVLWIPTKFYLKEKNNNSPEARWTLANSPVNLISFYANIFDSVNEYYNDKKELETIANLAPPWHIISAKPKYKNYVLIIGESARRDYMSVYGFKLATTPFLDKTNGYINSGYISAAPATYHSLLNTLYLKKENANKIDYSYNIITLAKAANIKSIWLSNQGSIGKYDTIASRLGSSADFSFFTKKGGYNTNNTDDFKLLDIFKDKLEESYSFNESRLFVIHLMGSHQSFCQRLNKGEKKYEFINEDLSCYVNSILKTDRLIENVISFLKEKNKSYSLIYFSDHGLSHINKDNVREINLDYKSEFKQSYNVPFVKISSDDLDRKVVNVKRSAFNFIYGFSQWLGIDANELNKEYDFFSDKNDNNIKVFNFEKNVPYETLEDDPIPED